MKRSAAALTLVEAVAGTAILGTLLVSMLMASGRMEVQSSRASRRIEACKIADSLLESWWDAKVTGSGNDNGKKFQRAGGGDVPGREGWKWRTSVVPNTSAEEFSAEVVALEIFSSGSGEKPLVSIEVMLPADKNEDN